MAQKRKFSEAGFLADGSPLSANDILYQPANLATSTTRQQLPSTVVGRARHNPDNAHGWGFELGRKVVNTFTNAFHILRTLWAPASIIAVPTQNCKRALIETASNQQVIGRLISPSRRAYVSTQRRPSSAPVSIIQRPRSRAPRKAVAFDMSKNQLVSPNRDSHDPRKIHANDDPQQPAMIPEMAVKHPSESPRRVAHRIEENDAAVATARQEREQRSRDWKARFVQMKKERDAARERIAELETVLASPTVVEKTQPKSLPTTNVNRESSTPSTNSTASSKAKKKNIWLELVDEDELAAELAEVSISVPKPKLIQPLSQERLASIQKALATAPKTAKLVNERSDITPQALSTLVGKNWLNDAVINEYIAHVVERQKQGAAKEHGDKPPATPEYVALNSNWWNTVRVPNRSYSVDDGLKKVLRWAKRAKIDGKKLLDVKDLYIPINDSAHWTLMIISGTDRTIEHLNSLKGCGPSDKQVFDIARRYLALHLGKDYDAGAWKELSERSSAQIGGYDCGAFTCFNAHAVAMGLSPGEAFGGSDMVMARQRISAVLLNSGFSGDLDWQ